MYSYEIVEKVLTFERLYIIMSIVEKLLTPNLDDCSTSNRKCVKLTRIAKPIEVQTLTSMGFVVVSWWICVNHTKQSYSKLQLSYRIFNSQEMFTSQYNICSPASLRLRLPIHILSIVPLTSFSGSNIYYQTRPQAIRLFVCCPSLRCGTVLVPPVFDNPHLYRLFHDCLRRIALRAAL